MGIKKAKKYLNKINLLFESVAADGEITNIERNLMLNYLTQMYDAFLEDNKPKKDIVKSTKEPTYEPPKLQPKAPLDPPALPNREPKGTLPKTAYNTPKVEVTKPKVKQPKPVEVPKQVEVVPPTPPVVEVPKQPTKPIEQPKPKPVAPKMPVVEVPRPVVKPVEPPKPVFKQEPVIQTPKEASTPQPTINPDLAILFEEERAQDLSARLSQTSIKDLKSAMGINERFLMINELFGGDSNKFHESIDILNSFDNFNQAKKYIATIADQLNWTDKKKVKRAKDFILKVRRRYK